VGAGISRQQPNAGDGRNPAGALEILSHNSGIFLVRKRGRRNQQLPRENQLKQRSGNAEYWFVKVDKALVEARKPLENSGF
jgi:hypothetical protein